MLNDAPVLEYHSGEMGMSEIDAQFYTLNKLAEVFEFRIEVFK